MIVAGIDEAGYGPLLGPLVVGCCAFELSDAGTQPASLSPDGQIPCLWKRLGKHVSKSKSASGRKLHINDSKLVYSPSTGLKELEKSVLAILLAMQSDAPTAHPSTLNHFLHHTAQHVLADLPAYPWYQPASAEPFPLEQDGLPIRLFANALREEMNRKSTGCVHLAARVVLERQLNRMLAATRNKASVLFSTAAIHIDYLLNQYGHQPLTIFCDRQGGREHYGSLLRLMFEDWQLEIIQEREGQCEYTLTRHGNSVRILFREKAESQCLPTALASMLSKYLREALMRRFNSYWKTHLPKITPTAGYYNDGTRFLQDIDTKRRELGISDEELIRSR